MVRIVFEHDTRIFGAWYAYFGCIVYMYFGSSDTGLQLYMCFGSSVAHSYGINYASFRLSYEQKFTIKYFLVSYTVFDSIIYIFFCVSLLIILVTKFFDVTPYDSPFQNLMFLLTAWVSCSFFSTWARESETFVHSNGPQVCFFHVCPHQRLRYAGNTRGKK